MDVDEDCLVCARGTIMVASTHRCEPASCVTEGGLLCNGGGDCREEAAGIASCECWSPLVASGPKCQTCGAHAVQATDGVCTAVSCLHDGRACAGHGECAFSPDSGLFKCVCAPSRGGDFCEICAPGFRDDGHGGCAAVACFAPKSVLACSGNGFCASQDDKWKCECTSATGDFCETCAENY